MRVRSFHAIDAAPYEHFNLHMKHSCRGTSRCRESRIEETVDRLLVTMNTSIAKCLSTPSARWGSIPRHDTDTGTNLVSNHFTVSFEEWREFLSATPCIPYS